MRPRVRTSVTAIAPFFLLFNTGLVLGIFEVYVNGMGAYERRPVELDIRRRPDYVWRDGTGISKLERGIAP